MENRSRAAMENEKKLTYETFLNLIDNLHDEINIWDHNYNLLYINHVCERHYGLKKEEMIGKNYFDFYDADFWYPSMLPRVYEEKKPLTMTQKTHIGDTITSIAMPFFNEKNEIEFVLSSVRDDIKDIPSLILDDNKKKQYEEKYDPLRTVVFKSAKKKEIMELTDKVADVDVPVIISGESGVGKTLLARVMHNKSKRKNKPFINVNCGAIPKDLMESELFGYAPGSFTGANREGKIGLFEAAKGGTILLDDISELPYMLQSKLLQVVQDKEFLPIGSQKLKKVDVKIIAATNKDLKKLVEADRFREDLYYRLSVFEINIPPLRERKEDIELLAFYFLNKFNKTYEKNHRLSDEVLEIMENYTWRGNVRELSHVIERMVVTVGDFVIKPHHLPKTLFEITHTTYEEKGSFDQMVEEFKKNIIVEAYKKNKSSRKVAAALNMTQSKAARLIREYIEAEEPQDK